MNTTGNTTGLAALFLVLAVHGEDPPPDTRDRIPVLVVSGAGDHDWEWTSRELVSMLEGSGRFDVELTLEPARTLADPAFLGRFRALVLDYDGPRWGEAAEAGFLEAVRTGTGVAVVHAAGIAFEGWTEYERLVGVVGSEGAEHGRFQVYGVEVTDRDHPVTRGLDMDGQSHPDRLYQGLVPTPGVEQRVLATAHGIDAVSVKTYGEGRVFRTAFGHVDEGSGPVHREPRFRELMVRGTEWAATGEVTEGPAVPNHLTDWEERAGWRILFEGETTEGWRGYGKDAFPEQGWSVADGALHHAAAGGGGALVSQDLPADFELEFEWRVAAGANSGVKYRFDEVGGRGPLGPEYQILDDAGHGDGGGAKTSAAALYAVYEPGPKSLAPAGEWNRARIVSRGDRLEHWLNGERVVEALVGSDDWRERIAASKFADVEGFARRAAGPMALQDHGDEVWFRSLRVRDPLDPGPHARRVELFDGETLDGWRTLGDAVYTVDDGAILGEVGGGGQSFLVTERTYADFILELDVKTELPGNSGIQIRSHVRDDGTLYGYQIEIDPSDRAWSGGLYDESRRGWLQDLKKNAPGRRAFRPGEWNRYRIECIGPTLRAWVNGVPTTTWADHANAEGVIGLQVHSGNDTRVRWRNFGLWEL